MKKQKKDWMSGVHEETKLALEGMLLAALALAATLVITIAISQII
jgi:hypothetical protein